MYQDPWIFVVHDLFSAEQCDALIEKCSGEDNYKDRSSETANNGSLGTKPKLAQATSSNSLTGEPSYRRTSKQVRLHYQEVPGLQARIASLIQVPVSNFEPMKVSLYEEGDRFGWHDDAIGTYRKRAGAAHIFPECPHPYSNRIATVIVYLNTCTEGGATRFVDFECTGEDNAEKGRGEQLIIHPKRGMGVVFMPGYLPTATRDPPDADDFARNGRIPGGKVFSLGHEALAAVDRKWICQQWAWPYEYFEEHKVGGTLSNRMGKEPLSETVL